MFSPGAKWELGVCRFDYADTANGRQSTPQEDSILPKCLPTLEKGRRRDFSVEPFRRRLTLTGDVRFSPLEINYGHRMSVSSPIGRIAMEGEPPRQQESKPSKPSQVYSRNGPIGHKQRGYILTMDQSDTSSAGIFSRWTNQTQ
eukprot:1181221-Prorocentrum_minimum.AAC.5